MKTKNYFVFLFFLIAVLLFYWNTRNAGFVTDFYGWQQRFEQGGWGGLAHSFGYKGLLQVGLFFFYLAYRVFDLHGFWWYLLFGALHALNGYLLYGLFARLLARWAVPQASLIALAGALLFLLSPYQSEVLVWRACMHYLLSSLCILSVLWLVTDYLERGSRSSLSGAGLVFFLSLFILEIVLITPLLVFLWVLVWGREAEGQPSRFLTNAVRGIWLSAPFFLLIGIYFFCNKIFIGAWIGHYGAETHLKFSLHDVLANYWKYFAKHLAFVRCWKHEYKMFVFDTLERKKLLYGLSVSGALGVAGMALFFSKINPRWRIAAAAVLMFFIALTPVITLYMVTLLHVENDRYGYLASMFLCMAIAIGFSAFPRRIFYGLCGLYLLVSAYYLRQNNGYWAESTGLYYSLLEDFRWYDRDTVIILNIPDNCEGAYVYRIIDSPSGFQEALGLIRRKPYTGRMVEVAQYNMIQAGDGVHVDRDSTGRLTVSFNQGGNWYWRKGIGASDYDNDLYKVHFEGYFYQLDWKNLPEKAAVIYQEGGKWKEAVIPR